MASSISDRVCAVSVQWSARSCATITSHANPRTRTIWGDCSRSDAGGVMDTGPVTPIRPLACVSLNAPAIAARFADLVALGRAPHYTARNDSAIVDIVRTSRPAARPRLARSRAAGRVGHRAARGCTAGAAVHPGYARDRQAVLGADDQLRTVGLGVRRAGLPLPTDTSADRQTMAADTRNSCARMGGACRLSRSSAGVPRQLLRAGGTDGAASG